MVEVKRDFVDVVDALDAAFAPLCSDPCGSSNGFSLFTGDGVPMTFTVSVLAGKIRSSSIICAYTFQPFLRRHL
jgi:hypothetical protein